MRITAVLVVVFGLTLAGAQHTSDAKVNPSLSKIKTLAGEWEGIAHHGDQDFPSHVVVSVVSDGSAVMHELDPGTSHDMVTLFHEDGSDLLATHYCAAHNQPRMKMVQTADPNVLQFEFKDGTNIAAGAGHMQAVKITFVDADHHYEDWSFIDGGKITTSRFEYHRKKS